MTSANLILLTDRQYLSRQPRRIECQWDEAGERCPLWRSEALIRSPGHVRDI